MRYEPQRPETVPTQIVAPQAAPFLFAFLFHLRIRAVESRHLRLVGIDLPDLSRQRVHQITVMRDQQDRPLIGVQHGLQDFLCRNIEVIGWFVEQ